MRFVGDEVVRVETMKVDGQKVVRVDKEVDVGASTVAKKEQARPANAPVGRSLYEWRWFETVDALFPGYVPKPVAMDEARGVLAMDFLEAEDHPLWKAQLLAGQVDVATASAVGRVLNEALVP